MNSSKKQSLRLEAIKHRDRINLYGEDPQSASDIFFEHLKPQSDQVVAAYWPKGNEMDTMDLLHSLIRAGVKCALPIIQDGSRELLFALWDESISLKKKKYDLLEPELTEDTQYVDPDIVVTPLLAFDRQGHRLGYGGGYYDATLQNLKERKKITIVGWAYAQQAVLFNLPAEEHDQPLDYVVTPKGIHCYTE